MAGRFAPATASPVLKRAPVMMPTIARLPAMPPSHDHALCVAAAGLLLALAAAPFRLHAQAADVFALQARFEAEEAHQAVAVDDDHFYAITNRAIGKYDKETGERVDSWQGAEDGPVVHLNSGVVIGDTLYAAHSNYPDVPMTSSVEMWNVRTMEHAGSHSFGIYEGSATWLDRHRGDWWVAFAHYGEGHDGGGPSGGVPGKGPEWTTLVRFSSDWQRRAAWTFPAAVIERMRPYSTSGGAWGPGGRLYVTGHDEAELYVLRLPRAGSTLQLVKMLAFPGQGQGIAWDPSRPGTLYGIRRASREVVVSVRGEEAGRNSRH